MFRETKPRLRIRAACGCDLGRVRSINEDNFYFNDRFLPADNQALKKAIPWETDTREPRVFAVFDGMGGESFGERAAHIAAETLGEALKEHENQELSGKSRILDYVNEANMRICRTMQTERISRMGTTAAILWVSSSEVIVCNVGDSRIYRWKDDSLSRLSIDHIDARGGEGAGAGQIRPFRKGSLTQHFGILPDEMVIEPYIAKGAPKSGDRYLICSDGLTDLLDDAAIAAVLGSQKRPQAAVERLIAGAVEAGGVDNVTAIVVDLAFPR
jgi:PPM family protein phosphatase